MSVNAEILFKHRVPLSAQEQGHPPFGVVLKKPVSKLEPVVRSQAAVSVKRRELRKFQEILITDPSIIAVCSTGAHKFRTQTLGDWSGYTVVVVQTVQGWRPFINRAEKTISASPTRLPHTFWVYNCATHLAN